MSGERRYRAALFAACLAAMAAVYLLPPVVPWALTVCALWVAAAWNLRMGLLHIRGGGQIKEDQPKWRPLWWGTVRGYPQVMVRIPPWDRAWIVTFGRPQFGHWPRRTTSSSGADHQEGNT